MMLDRFVDLIFKTLDAADAVKDQVDNALGRGLNREPWVVTWPPPSDGPKHADAKKKPSKKKKG